MPLEKRKRILVTGGAGLLGSHLCGRLVAEGHEILCMDNFSTGTRHNIHHLLGEAGFESIRHDVTLPLSLEVDEIYHLACPDSPRHRRLNPADTARTCVLGAIHMLELAMRADAKILLASAGEVCLDAEEHPQTERCRGYLDPAEPASCCSEGMRCAEALFFGYRRQHGVDIRVARIFDTYGPGMQAGDGGRVIGAFIARALKDEDLTVYGDGSQTRSFCFVEDVVEGIVRMMNGPGDLTGPLNLGFPWEMRIFDLAETVIRLSGARSGIVFEPLPPGRAVRRCPDITEARRRLKWRPATDFPTGFDRTIAYFRSMLRS